VAIPGARGPLFWSTLGSMPIGMFTLAILLLAHDATDDFGTAGRVAGAFAFANAVGALIQGRLMDRHGQTAVLRIAAAGHLPAHIALVVAARGDASAWVLALFALAGGLTLPQLPAAMRSLWNALVPDPEQRATAYALVAVVFEVAVVTAPALVALIVAVADPGTAVIIAATVGVLSALAFTSRPVSRHWRGRPHDAGWLGPLAAPGMRTVFGVLAAFGTAVGIVQVAVPAFADQHGNAATGGVLLAALSAGSLAGGLLYGARTWPGTPNTRLTTLMLILGGMFALLATAGSQLVLAALLVAAGLLFAPTTVVGSTLLDTVAPQGTVTEAFAAMVMGIVAGTALGNALGGTLVESSSYGATVLIAGAVAVVGSGLALSRRRTLSGSRATPRRSAA
jgi:MFS family permease